MFKFQICIKEIDLTNVKRAYPDRSLEIPMSEDYEEDPSTPIPTHVEHPPASTRVQQSHSPPRDNGCYTISMD